MQVFCRLLLLSQGNSKPAQQPRMRTEAEPASMVRRAQRRQETRESKLVNGKVWPRVVSARP